MVYWLRATHSSKPQGPYPSPPKGFALTPTFALGKSGTCIWQDHQQPSCTIHSSSVPTGLTRAWQDFRTLPNKPWRSSFVADFGDHPWMEEILLGHTRTTSQKERGWGQKKSSLRAPYICGSWPKSRHFAQKVAQWFCVSHWKAQNGALRSHSVPITPPKRTGPVANYFVLYMPKNDAKMVKSAISHAISATTGVYNRIVQCKKNEQ